MLASGWPGISSDGGCEGDTAKWRGSPRVAGPILLAKPTLDFGVKDNVEGPFPIAGPDGAFTFEALVKLDMMPQDSRGLALDIFSMDDESSSNRVFIFRIEKPGFLSFLPISGHAVRGGGLATIPTSGPHALNTTDWFHAAVAYDGRETAVNNLKLYWTRLNAGNESANLIGQGTLTADLGQGLGDFAIGNSGATANEFFPGLIDEVRISGIARPPHDFCFVSENVRAREDELSRRAPPLRPAFGMKLQQVLVGEQVVAMPGNDRSLVLGSGLHRLYRSVTGNTIGKDLAARRVRAAADMLREVDVKLEPVAMETGLHSAKNLCRLFKGHLGLTPGQWKESWHRQHAADHATSVPGH